MRARELGGVEWMDRNEGERFCSDHGGCVCAHFLCCFTVNFYLTTYLQYYFLAQYII